MFRVPLIMYPPSSSSLSRRVFLQSLALGGASTVTFGAAGLPKLPTVDEETRQAAKAAALRLVFKGSTPGELAAWQQEFSAALRERIGPHQPPQRWSDQLMSRVEFPDHVREEWLLAAGGVPSLPLYILKPAGARAGSARLPIVVALHGHDKFGHDAIVGIDDTPERAQEIRDHNYDFGRQLVWEGYLVVVPCMTPFGRRLDESYQKGRTDPCATTFVRLMLLGQTLMGANLRDVKWAVSYAQSRADAWPDRVGCVGLSYGGRMTMLASALDERISVAVVSGALNVMQERIEGHYSCGGQVVPRLLEIGDTPEIGSLIAPRPCIWEVGSKDGLVKPVWADAAKERLGRAYAAAGKPAALQFHHFEGGHRWDGVTAVPLLAKILQRG
jgi:dienelactone hydrolase